MRRACHERATEGQFRAQDAPAEERESKLLTAPGRPPRASKRSLLTSVAQAEYIYSEGIADAAKQRAFGRSGGGDPSELACSLPAL